MAKTKKPVQVEYKTLVVIWAALLMSQIVFVLIVYLVKPELFTPDPARPLLGDQPLVTIVFAVGAVVAMVLGFVFRNQHMARAVVDQDASCVQTGLVLGCAFSEACSVLGLILAFVFEYQFFWAWIAFGLLGILFHFPRKGNLEAARYQRS